jgi:rare lipoprotein A (peptidoglycan hydrolase)
VTTWQTGTAALLPCGARLTLWKGRRKVHVTVMDHGPYVPGRSLDVWPATERALGYRSDAAWGVQSVRMAMGWR